MNSAAAYPDIDEVVRSDPDCGARYFSELASFELAVARSIAAHSLSLARRFLEDTDEPSQLLEEHAELLVSKLRNGRLPSYPVLVLDEPQNRVGLYFFDLNARAVDGFMWNRMVSGANDLYAAVLANNPRNPSRVSLMIDAFKSAVDRVRLITPAHTHLKVFPGTHSVLITIKPPGIAAIYVGVTDSPRELRSRTRAKMLGVVEIADPYRYVLEGRGYSDDPITVGLDDVIQAAQRRLDPDPG